MRCPGHVKSHHPDALLVQNEGLSKRRNDISMRHSLTIRRGFPQSTLHKYDIVPSHTNPSYHDSCFGLLTLAGPMQKSTKAVSKLTGVIAQQRLFWYGRRHVPTPSPPETLVGPRWLWPPMLLHPRRRPSERVAAEEPDMGWPIKLGKGYEVCFRYGKLLKRTTKVPI